MEITIVTGLSGAGKSRVVDALEDIGYFCVDNMPPKLMPTFAQLLLNSREKREKVAIVTDIRVGASFGDLFNAIVELKELKCDTKLLFIDASDDVLIRRYKETRRKHPLLDKYNGSINDALAAERSILEPAKSIADYVIDSSHMTPTDCKNRICEMFLDNPGNALKVHCVSFGFKYGIPNDSDLMFDVRCLPNPFYVAELKQHTGLEDPVRDYVLKWDEARGLEAKLCDLLDYLIPLYRKKTVSFSSDVKQELAQVTVLSDCCAQARAYGMLLFGRMFSVSEISFVTENENIAKLYRDVIKELFDITPSVSSGVSKYTVSVADEADSKRILEFFGHSESDISLRINRANLPEDCCFGAFLRGVFIACGTISSPEKNYHLEFSVSYKKLCNDLIQLLDEVGFAPKYVKRKSSHIVYFKVSEKIEEFLTLVGAVNSTLELMGIKMHKDMVNHVNRRVNFENANLSRTVDAAIVQVEAIEKIERTVGLESLPVPLAEMAKLRRDNPEVSLSELANMTDPPLTRSGVNHRLKRLVEIAGGIGG